MKNDNKANEQLLQEINELKTKVALNQFEKNFRDIFDNTIDAIYIQDKEGHFLEVNQGAANMYGYPKKFFIGKTPEFLSAPGKNDMKKIIGFVKNAFNGKPQRYDFWGIRKNGEVFLKIVRSHHGLYLGQKVVITFALDITDRKKAEDALKESEEKLRLMIDNSHIGFSSTDLNGNFIDVNPAMCNMIGFSKKEMMQKHYDQFSHPDDKAKNKDLYQKLVAGGIPYFDLEKRYIHKNGKIIHALIRAQIVHDDEGKPLFEFAITEDITERKKAEEKINLLSNIVKQSMEGMAQADLNGNLIFINDAWCEMHGYKSYKELLGKNLSIFHNKEQLENDVIPFNEKVMKYGNYSGEVGHITKDGKPFPTLMTTTVLKDDKGTPYGIAGIAKDITERKQEERIQAVIYNISNAVTTTKNLNDLYKIIHQQLGNILNVTNFYIANYNEQTDEIFSPYFITDNAEIKVPHKFRKNGVTNYIIKNTKSLFLTEELRQELIDQGEIANYTWSSKALLGVPLRIGEKIVGCIVVRSSREESHYSNKDLSILEFVSSQVAIAIAHKQAEKALLESEERFRSIFSNISNIAVQGYDKERKVTFWNKASEKLYGYSQDEAMNKQLEELIIPPEMRENVILMINNWHENNVPIPNGELALVKKDKSLIHVYSSHVMIEKSNKEKEMFCIDINITERKLAEEELKKKMKELEIFNEATVDREIMINESRKEINELLIKLGEEPKYEIVE